MKKFVKASIATAAGITLLLGGAGTFATWNAKASAGSAEIVAGNLVVKSKGEGVWMSGNTAIDINTYAIVPGEVLTYTKEMTVIAEGEQLTAELGLTGGSVAAVDKNNPADVELAKLLVNKNSNVTLTAAGEGIVLTSPNTFSVTPGDKKIEETVTVTVTVAFPDEAEGAENDAMRGKVSLGGLDVTLTQTID